MDKTETYIKMCDCPEIQEQKPSTHYYDPNFVCSCGHSLLSGLCPMRVKGEEHRVVWLPRQDQLQEMVNYGLMYQVGMFSEFVVAMKGNWITGENEKFGSMEQLWLAFVMEEKFNKVWDGETWIKRQYRKL